MKLKVFFAVAVLASFAACKAPYKATDKPVAKTDNSSPTVDSSATATSTSALPTDSAKMSAKIDSLRQPVTTDSAKIPSVPDSTKIPSTPDSTKMPSVVDSTKTPSATKTSTTGVTVPAAVVTVPAVTLTAFTTQYPGATNVVWSGYDSLAQVPIDLRMAGWKKMDADDHLVTFDLDNNNYYAWYDSEGKWVGSAYTMTDITKLPPTVNTAVKNAIKTRYVGYTISNVNREFQKDKKTYEVELVKDNNKVKMLVNSDGKITQVYKYVKDKTK